MAPDNINNNIYINNIYNTRAGDKKTKHKYGEYKNVLLSDEDLDKLKREFPQDWGERIQTLSEYIECHGKKYKNHLAVIRNWARNDALKRGGGIKPNLPFSEPIQRPEYDDTVFDRLLEEGEVQDE